MSAGIRLTSLTFKSGATVRCADTNIIIIVGPNNVGKSRTLNDVDVLVTSNNNGPSTVVQSVEVEYFGSRDDFWKAIKDSWTKSKGVIPEAFSPQNGGGVSPITYAGTERWPSYFGGHFSSIFKQVLRTNDRITGSNSVQSVHFGRVSSVLPLHLMHQNFEMQKKVSSACEQAFGVQIGVDVMAGSMVPLYIGFNAAPNSLEERTSPPYLEHLRSLREVSEEGDGVRSFVSILINRLQPHKTISLIDEPEAFLHPP